jgi:hypothetical protein
MRTYVAAEERIDAPGMRSHGNWDLDVQAIAVDCQSFRCGMWGTLHYSAGYSMVDAAAGWPPSIKGISL